MNRKKRIAIFSNLPSGGARELYDSNIRYLKSHYVVSEINETIFKPSNFFEYLYISLISIPKFYKNLSRTIDQDFDLILAYHSWITKSPSILKYSKLPKIYICHEPMREYTDNLHIQNQTLKESIINIIRIPIKIQDKNNLKTKNLVVIANSKFSKKIIDNYYNVSSKIIYPGINTGVNISSIKKENKILSVGAINKLKGFQFIIEVVSQIDKRMRPNLSLIGNGGDNSYISTLKSRAKELDVNLTIKTNISREELSHEYLTSKVFAYAPLNEPFGIVVEEAMSCGLPILAYAKGGGYAELLNNKTGILLDDLDIQEWSQSLAKMLNSGVNKYNMKLIKNDYSDDVMNDNLVKVIEKL